MLWTQVRTQCVLPGTSGCQWLLEHSWVEGPPLALLATEQPGASPGQISHAPCCFERIGTIRATSCGIWRRQACIETGKIDVLPGGPGVALLKRNFLAATIPHTFWRDRFSGSSDRLFFGLSSLHFSEQAQRAKSLVLHVPKPHWNSEGYIHPCRIPRVKNVWWVGILRLWLSRRISNWEFDRIPSTTLDPKLHYCGSCIF